MTIEEMIANQASQIEEIMPDLLDDVNKTWRVLKDIPIVTEDTHLIEFVQRDNIYGLQGASVLDGDPQYVKRIGADGYKFQPSVFRDVTDFGEKEVTTMRELNDREQPIRVESLLRGISQQLLTRQTNRIGANVYKTLIEGSLDLNDEYGNPVGKYKYARNHTSVTGGEEWNNVSAAKPLKHLRDWKAGITGTSSVFNAGATILLNSVTANYMLSNTNAGDLGGKFMGGGNTLNSIEDINKIVVGQDLPKLEICDDGWLDDTNTWVKGIPDGKLLAIGARPGGAKLGKYVMTRNAVNQNAAPGPYYKVFSPDQLAKKVPAKWEVHAGHNAGVVIHYVTALRVITVYTP